ncbi:MAG: PBP1A family penicillin-binding protein [Spirochaetes bacterium]|nr:PBP1A family penicillin-binding protein [Spirochaetota bacterium]
MEKLDLRRIERIALVTFACFCVVGGIMFGYVTSEIKNYSGIDNLKAFQPSIPTRLYDVNREVIAELFRQRRYPVSFEEIPPCLINAFLSAEDQGFYDHFGIDPPAIFRAMGKNLIASIKSLRPVIVQGGSTITQQLAKRLFTSGERTYARKALEAILALQIEKRFTKEEILEMYFNQIYFGHGCHGVAAAAEFFFNKNIGHLSLIESSVLAGLPSRPNGLSPIKYPRRARARNRDILNRIVGEGYLTGERADRLYEEFWPAFIDSIIMEYPTKTAHSKTNDRAPYFTDYVRQILVARFGEDAVYNDGLSVYTTLDLRQQELAESIMSSALKKQDSVYVEENQNKVAGVESGRIDSYEGLRMIFSLPLVSNTNDDDSAFKQMMADHLLDSIEALSLFVQAPGCSRALEAYHSELTGISSVMNVEGALIAIEPFSGYIKTMVGGSQFEVQNQYNRAVQAKRQPGSAFKPFVYGAAIENKLVTTETVLPDAPILDIDAIGNSWTPGNYEGEYMGLVPLNRALSASINVISIRLYDIVGPDKIINYASKMTKVPPTYFGANPSLALGTAELTPYEMATGYAIYANRGKDVIPFAVRYIVDRDGNEIANIEGEVGEILARKAKNGTIQVISEDVAWIMTQMMMRVIDSGTATEGIRVKGGYTRKGAGKTGTTSNWSDAWFCGFTPDITAVVWIGYDQSLMSLGKHQSASEVAAPVWARYMNGVYRDRPDPVFPPMPPGVCQYGQGWGLAGAKTQYYDAEGDNSIMKSVLERYMEIEGLIEERKRPTTTQ